MKEIKIPKNTYKKTYRIRQSGFQSRTNEVTIPPQLIDKAASDMGFTTKEFIKQFSVEWLYGDYNVAFIRFIQKY